MKDAIRILADGREHSQHTLVDARFDTRPSQVRLTVHVIDERVG